MWILRLSERRLSVRWQVGLVRISRPSVTIYGNGDVMTVQRPQAQYELLRIQIFGCQISLRISSYIKDGREYMITICMPAMTWRPRQFALQCASEWKSLALQEYKEEHVDHDHGENWYWASSLEEDGGYMRVFFGFDQYWKMELSTILNGPKT